MESLLQYRKWGTQLQAEYTSLQKSYGDNILQTLSNTPAEKENVQSPVASTPSEDTLNEIDVEKAPASNNDSAATAMQERLGVFCEDVPEVGFRFVVKFQDEQDRNNPKDWIHSRKLVTTGIVGCTGLLVGWASAIDSTAIDQMREEFHVSEVVQSLATALYLVGFGFGSLVSGPLSETVGRNPVYLGSLAIFMIWVMASGLAPNIAAQLVFRFLAGFFGCTPLTTFGGSVSDMFTPLHRTYVFPVMACLSFLGPFLAPMVGAYIGQSSLISWRWTEWTTLIMAGLVTAGIFFFVPETYAPILLDWKAAHLRRITKDDRFVSEASLNKVPFLKLMRTNIVRPFEMFFSQLIVVLWCIYLSVVYIVLFTFLTGYTFIFTDIYGFSQGKTGLMFLGLNIGFLIALAICPLIYIRYKKVLAESTDGSVAPEERLVYAMIAAPFFPISLFWMGWTSDASISVWSPLIASVFFGFAVQGIFISSYLYLIDAFEKYAASALVGLTLTRYVAAGGMTVVSWPMYQNLGVHYTLTVLGCIAAACTPIPYLFYRYGASVRARNPVKFDS